MRTMVYLNNLMHPIKAPNCPSMMMSLVKTCHMNGTISDGRKCICLAYFGPIPYRLHPRIAKGLQEEYYQTIASGAT